jgi:periplasmic divalent cation tolerance protein
MPDFTEDAILVVTTTAGSMDDARRLAAAIVQARLAACVQLDAIGASFYPWDGQLCDEPEVRLTIKTLPALREALQAFLSGHHPYDLPQFVAVIAGASKAYADWVRSQVQG